MSVCRVIPPSQLLHHCCKVKLLELKRKFKKKIKKKKKNYTHTHTHTFTQSIAGEPLSVIHVKTSCRIEWSDECRGQWEQVF